MRSLALVPYANVTVKTDVPATMRNYMLEREQRLPGRRRQQGLPAPLPAQATSPPSCSARSARSRPSELELDRFRGVRQGTVVGQDGHRARLRPLPARRATAPSGSTVNALGQPEGAGADARAGRRARSCARSLDLDLQKAGEAVMSRSIADGPRHRGRVRRDGPAQRRGPRAWAPTRASTRPCCRQARSPQRRYEELFGEAAGSPLFNRAIGGLYPTGSTFKPITALAGARHGPDHARRRRSTTPAASRSAPPSRSSATPGKAAHGAVALRAALQVSSDVYFYTLGRDLNPLDGQPLQRWARKLGARRADGHRPARRGRGHRPRPRVARRRRPTAERGCRKQAQASRARSRLRHLRHAPVDGRRQRQPLRRPGRPAGHAAADGASPTRRSPTAAASCARTSASPSRTPGPPDPAHRAGRRAPGQDRPGRAGRRSCDGLHAGGQRPGGTSADVFRGWHQARFPVFGKTGTAERPARTDDQSWYVAYVPQRRASRSSSPSTVEDGGFGAEAAAPSPRLILAKWFGAEDGQVRRAGRVDGTRERRTPIQDVAEPPAAAPARAARARWPAVRPVLLLAVLGLCAAARWSPSPAPPRTTSPARPTTTSTRQARLLRRRPGPRRRPVARSTTRGCASSSTASTAC